MMLLSIIIIIIIYLFQASDIQKGPIISLRKTTLHHLETCYSLQPRATKSCSCPPCISAFLILFFFETFIWMKFCLWKNYITWDEEDFLLFFILLSHDCCLFVTCSLQYFGFCSNISEMGGGVQRHESEGMRAMLPSLPNLFLLIASPQPTAFAKTHKIKGKRVKRIFQRSQPRSYPECLPTQEVIPSTLRTGPENLQKNVRHAQPLLKLSSTVSKGLGYNPRFQVLPASHTIIGSIRKTRRYPALKADEL